MLDYLQKQKRQAITGVTEVVASSAPKEPAQYKGRFKLNSWSHKTNTKSLNARREKSLAKYTTVKRTNERSSVPEKPDPDPGLSIPKQHQSLNPVLFLDSGQLDPFDSRSIKLGRSSEGLLLHCEYKAIGVRHLLREQWLS